MIQLTRLNQRQLVLNSDLIEHIDVTPDTVITLMIGIIATIATDATGRPRSLSMLPTTESATKVCQRTAP